MALLVEGYNHRIYKNIGLPTKYRVSKKNVRLCLEPDISWLDSQIMTYKVNFDIVTFSAFK